MPGKNLPLLAEKKKLKYGSWFAVYCAAIHHMLPVTNKGLGIRQSAVSFRNTNELICSLVLCTAYQNHLTGWVLRDGAEENQCFNPVGHQPRAKWLRLTTERLCGWEEKVFFLELLKLSDPGAWILFILRKLQKKQCKLLLYLVQRMRPWEVRLSP